MQIFPVCLLQNSLFTGPVKKYGQDLKNEMLKNNGIISIF